MLGLFRVILSFIEGFIVDGGELPFFNSLRVYIPGVCVKNNTYWGSSLVALYIVVILPIVAYQLLNTRKEYLPQMNHDIIVARRAAVRV